MSFAVMAIAGAHALPPIIGAVITKKRGGVYFGAAIGVLIAVAIGNSAFIVPDLIGIGIGTWLGLSLAK